MSLSPEDITLGDRPLLVCDVDDVVVEFFGPFRAYLAARGLALDLKSFRLHGNIRGIADDLPIDDTEIPRLIDGFFAEQELWQTPLAEVAETLTTLGRDADVVFLTSMPPEHYGRRRALLDTLALPFPLIATRAPKGPLVAALHRARPLPVAFIDDMAHNLHSVSGSVQGCGLVHLLPALDLRALAPPAPGGVLVAADWREAAAHIAGHFGLTERPVAVKAAAAESPPYS